MTTPAVFDVCVVGAGLWGSAAAKYCSEQDGISVCLVGPSEPATKQERDSRFVFGAHYDEGRIYGSISSDIEWGQLARRSINKYKPIEEMTDIQLYNDVGLLRVAWNSQLLQDVAKQTDTELQLLDSDQLSQRFNFLSLGKYKSGLKGVFQQEDAGYINPRNLIKVQQKIARRQRCQIFDDIVSKVIFNEAQELFELATERGNSFNAKKVLLCTGATTAFDNLLPDKMQLDMTLTSQEVVLMELTESDRDMLRGMPSIIIDESDEDLGRDCYVLPPIKYPDGKVYLKIGHGSVGEFDITSKEELKSWYCGPGISSTADRLAALMHDLIPGLKPLSVHSDTCVTVTTPSGQLYCDMVSPGLGILVGCNGHGAKSSDEIGRMGASMILHGQWNHDMPQEKFKARWKPTSHK